MTECNQSGFEFKGHCSRGGCPLMTTAMQAVCSAGDRPEVKLFLRLAGCFPDDRNAARTEHTVQELVAWRIYGLVLDYEDLNDHEQLRNDLILRLLSAKGDFDR